MPSPRSFRCWDTQAKRFLEEMIPPEGSGDRLLYDLDTELYGLGPNQERRRIYENDIISFTIKGITHGPEREEIASAQVWYCQEDACWAFGQWKVPFSTKDTFWWYTMQDRIDRSTLRVIGNVWMNPEMLTHEVVK